MRNHFVPEFLQRPWTGEDGKLQKFSLEHGSSARRAPKANGFEYNLLSLTRDDLGVHKHVIETVFLQRVDQEASDVHKKILEHGLQLLTLEERCAWVRFLMSLRLRQPKNVNYLKMEGEKTLRDELFRDAGEYDVLAEDHELPGLEAWAEANFPGLIENFGLSIFHEVVDNPRNGTKLLNLGWWTWRFRNEEPSLLLGDQPCIFTAGLDDPNLTVVLPIAPRVAFIATRSKELSAMLPNGNGKVFARHFNDASVRQAESYIFALDDNHRRFIQNRRPPGRSKSERESNQ